MIYKKSGKCVACKLPCVEVCEILETIDMLDPDPRTPGGSKIIKRGYTEANKKV